MLTHGERIRLTELGREQFWLFSLLKNGTRHELARRGLSGAAVAVTTDMGKSWRTVFFERDCQRVGGLGREHQRKLPAAHRNLAAG